MQKCVMKLNPAVLLQIFQNRRSLLEVKCGADSMKTQGITMVQAHERTGEIAIFYEQQELVDLPSQELIVKEIHPNIGIADLPDDINDLTKALQEIADVCVHKLGYPAGQALDIPTFLTETIAPFICGVSDGEKRRLN